MKPVSSNIKKKSGNGYHKINSKWNFLVLILKKKLYFLKRKLFLYFRKWNLSLSKPKPKNFRKWNFLALILKRKLCFLKRKLFFIFSQKTFLIFPFSKAFQKSLYFRKTELSYASGKEYSESWHNGTFLYFPKWGFLPLYFSYISGSNFSSLKIIIIIIIRPPPPPPPPPPKKKKKMRFRKLNFLWPQET